MYSRRIARDNKRGVVFIYLSIYVDVRRCIYTGIESRKLRLMMSDSNQRRAQLYGCGRNSLIFDAQLTLESLASRNYYFFLLNFFFFFGGGEECGVVENSALLLCLLRLITPI